MNQKIKVDNIKELMEIIYEAVIAGLTFECEKKGSEWVVIFLGGY